MVDLPLELLESIVKGVGHDPSLFSLRLVSKTLSYVVTPLAFTAVVVKDSTKSAEAVSFLQGCDESVTSQVREIIFRGHTQRAEGGEEDSASNETARTGGRRALGTVFSQMKKFPKLRNLHLDFHGRYEEDEGFTRGDTVDNPTYFLLVQREILTALAANPPSSLVSLTLHNLIPVRHDIYAQENFHRIFGRLEALEISVLSDVDLIGAHIEDPFTAFWKESVPHMIRSATALTTLTIRSSLPVGVVPKVPSGNICLPRLASLALHKFQLNGWDDIVKFILRHKSTLTHLELHDCSSSVDAGENTDYLCSWHEILALFEAELGGLRDFVFENKRDVDEDVIVRDPRFEYTVEDSGIEFFIFGGEVHGEEQDLPALESLLAVVKSRYSKNDE
ncbi:hypothetical protein B0H19DRAFT_1276981 [Mycena capillaripes]|nr:hypothetical protein B0H19DRAFT_1276981 [Mycena capillaripes]